MSLCLYSSVKRFRTLIYKSAIIFKGTHLCLPWVSAERVTLIINSEGNHIECKPLFYWLFYNRRYKGNNYISPVRNKNKSTHAGVISAVNLSEILIEVYVCLDYCQTKMTYNWTERSVVAVVYYDVMTKTSSPQDTLMTSTDIIIRHFPILTSMALEMVMHL